MNEENLGGEAPNASEDGNSVNAGEEKTSEEEIKGEPEIDAEQINSLKSQLEEEKNKNISIQIQKERFRDKLRQAQEELDAVKTKPLNSVDLTKHPDWDIMTDIERETLRETHKTKQKIESIEKSLLTTKAKLEKSEMFNNVMGSFPQLKEQKKEFQEFLGEDIPTDKLAKAFLYEQAEEIGAKKERELANRKGLEKKSGGFKTAPKTDISYEDIKRLRETDYEKYKEFLANHSDKLPKIE